MILKFDKLDVKDDIIKISTDGGQTYTDYSVSEIKNNDNSIRFNDDILSFIIKSASNIVSIIDAANLATKKYANDAISVIEKSLSDKDTELGGLITENQIAISTITKNNEVTPTKDSRYYINSTNKVNVRVNNCESVAKLITVIANTEASVIYKNEKGELVTEPMVAGSVKLLYSCDLGYISNVFGQIWIS